MHASARLRTSAGFASERGLPTAALRRVRILDEELALRALPRLYAAADAFVLPSRGEGWGRPHVEAMAMGLPVIATNWSAPPRPAPHAHPRRPRRPKPRLHPPQATPPRVPAPPSLAPIRALTRALAPHLHAYCTPTLAPLCRAAPLGRSGPTAFLSEETGYPLDYDLAPLPGELNQPGHRWAEPSVAHLRQLMRRVVEQPAEARRRGAAARAHMVARFSPASLASDVARQLERIGDSAVWASREELWGPRRKPKKKKRGSFSHYSDTVNVPH